MAVTAATKTTDFSGFLPSHIADSIFEKAAEQSVIMRLAQRVPLSINGESIPVVTGEPTAGWVAEGATKPSSKGTLALKTMTPQKLAAILVVSQEVIRANPGGYVGVARNSLAGAFAKAFDYAATQDAGPDGTVGGGPFSTYLAQGSKTQELGTVAQANGGTYGDLVAAMSQLLSTENSLGRFYELNGWALSPRAEPILLASTDTTGRPLWVDAPAAAGSPAFSAGTRSGSLLGRPAVIGRGVDYFSTLGWAGDWSQAAWGAIGDITFTVSTEASVTINGSLVSAFENNLVVIRAEAEYGWVVNDTAAFVELTDVQTS